MGVNLYNKYHKNQHHAVALGYNAGEDAAPKILAQAKGLTADRLLEIAEANDIPISEDAELVEILKLVEVGNMIPIEAYSAVAEILGYIYSYGGKK